MEILNPSTTPLEDNILFHFFLAIWIKETLVCSRPDGPDTDGYFWIAFKVLSNQAKSEGQGRGWEGSGLSSGPAQEAGHLLSFYKALWLFLCLGAAGVERELSGKFQ